MACAPHLGTVVGAQHDDPGLAIPHFLEGVEHLADHLIRERVAVLGVIHGDGADKAVEVAQDHGHGILPGVHGEFKVLASGPTANASRLQNLTPILSLGKT